jgi:hypothetical protein
MRPGQVFTVATRADPENAPFNVVVHGQGISVWVNAGLDAEVFDAQGGLVPCAQVPANEAVAVRLVRSHAAGLAAGPADGPGNPDLARHRLELRAVRSLAFSDEQRERSAASVRTAYC